MPRLTTTPKRLRSGARRRPLVPVGPSPASVKKLRVDMLRGYLASYQLPTTGTKQQLAERLTYHLRSIAAKKIQRSSGQQKNSRAGGKKTQKSTQPEAPPPREPTPHESSDSEEDTGSQQSPSGEQGSPRSPPSSGRKSRSRRAKPYSRHRSRQRSHSTSSEEHSLSDSQSSASSEEHSTRARKRHASHSHAPPPKHRRYRRSRSTSSESPRRRRHHRHRDSSLSSTSTSSYTSSTSTSSSSHHRRYRRSRKHRSRRSRRHTSSTTGVASISCAPPLSGHLQDRIKQGKYVNFDKLLLPPHTPPLFAGSHKSSKKRKLDKRQVTDLNSWLEAWNRYATCRIASDPTMALELVKYQTVVALLFSRYLAPSVIEYDRLFRQAAARDRAMRWDSPKEDIYVWALTQSNSTSNNVASHFSTGNNLSGGNSTSQSFRDRVPIAARLGPPVKPNTPNTDRATHLPSGKEICKRFNLGKCTKGEDCIFAHNCWHSNCQGDHPGKGCPKRF